MGTRIVVGLALLALLVLAAAWLLPRSRDARPALAVPRASEPVRADAERPVTSPEREVESPREPLPAASSRAPASAQARAPRLRGLLLVVEEDGRELPAAQARFALRVADAPDDPPREVVVREGRFELELEARGELLVSALRLGDGAGRFERERLPVPTDGELVLRARRLPPVTLRVLDALSGADLRGVVVLVGVPAWRDRVAPTAWTDEHLAVEDGVSPLALPPREGVVTYWVGARGYGWRALEVDHDAGGEREVRLAPAASLEVLVEGPREGLPLRIRLYPDGVEEGRLRRTLAEAVPDEHGRALLSGLPAGAYALLAEVGMWYDPPHVLAQEALELVAGERAQVVLRLEHPLLELAPAALAGEVVLPEEQAELDFALRILPAGRAPLRSGDQVRLSRSKMEPVAGHAGVLRFDAGELTPGVYAAVVDPPQWLELIELAEGERREVRLVLPELHVVEIEVVDALGEEPLAPERIAWSVTTPDALRTWTYQNVPAGASPGRFSWLAPAGSIQVLASAPGFGDANVGLEVRPGGVSRRLALRPLLGARLTFLDGEAVVPASWSHSGLELRRLGESRPLERGRGYELEMDDAARWRVLVAEPGWYELALPELPGFERPAPLELELAPGAVREVRVRLLRAR